MTTFQTTDLGLVAFLRCNGYLITDLQREGAKIAFVFNDQPERKQLIIDYFNGAKISCIDFMAKLQEAKTLMRQVI